VDDAPVDDAPVDERLAQVANRGMGFWNGIIIPFQNPIPRLAFTISCEGGALMDDHFEMISKIMMENCQNVAVILENVPAGDMCRLAILTTPCISLQYRHSLLKRFEAN